MTWDNWKPATCWPDACFCEAVHDSAIRQPSNTWSALAFCVVGALILAEQLKRKQVVGLRPVEAICLAFAIFFLGATSAFYHASLSFLGQWLDVQSMYLLVFLAVAVNVDALRPGKPPRFALTYVGLNVALGLLIYVVPEIRRFAFGGAFILIIGTEILLRRRKLRSWSLKPMVASGVVQGIAFVIWTLDIKHVVCDPQSLIQGHAIWHLLGAWASWLLWRYYAGPRAR